MNKQSSNELSSIKDECEAIAKKEEKEYSLGLVSGQENGTDYYKAIIANNLIKESDFKSMDLPDRPYYMEPWLRDGTLALLYAKRGVGKTWFGLCIAIAITRKLPIGPWNTIKPVGCVYIDGEMAADELQDRIKKLTTGLPDPLAQLRILSSDLLHANNNPLPNLSNDSWRKAIYEFLAENDQYKILFLDNLSSLTPGIIENDKQEWDEINQWLLNLRFLGVAVILIHHAGKSGEQRGTSGREDNIDISICLTRPKSCLVEEGAVFEVELKKVRGIRGSGVVPFTLQIQEVEGKLTWTTEMQKPRTKKLIIAMLGREISQNEISDSLGCDKGYVSKVKKQAIKDGILIAEGNKITGFTTKGEQEYGEVDIDRYLQ